MKRKLIEYKVFEKMRDGSLSAAINELAECEEHLARALDKGRLTLESFDEGSVTYQTDEGTYVSANYEVDAKNVKFDNVEELVINEETERKEVRSVVENLLEALLGDDGIKAETLFEKYMGFASGRYKRSGTLCTESLSESYVRIYGTRGKAGQAKVSRRSGAKDPKRVAAAKKAHRLHPGSYKKGGQKRTGNLSKEKARRGDYKKDYGKLRALSGGKQYTGRRRATMLADWTTLAANVFQFVEWKENGHVINETIVRTNESGDVVSVKIPNINSRNEGKIQHQKYKHMMGTELKVLREHGRRLAADQAFCTAVAEIKRYNNVSANAELEESIGGLVGHFPAVLYLTQEELAKTIGAALDNVGDGHYDDKVCDFMAEGILRMAHEAYSDRVERILKFANQPVTTSEDNYKSFQSAASAFFPTLDESIDLEKKVFEDLYNVTCQIRSLALESHNDLVKNEAQEFIADLEGVLSGHLAPDVTLAEEVAEWLNNLAETNMTGGSWEVVKTPHQTVTGDHPQMAKNAKVPAIAGNNEGDWGDPAPMISGDKKGYKGSGAPDEARHRAFANKGGKDVWPNLTNPVVPTPYGDYTMKGEKGADKDSDQLATWSSGSTVPTLVNPYLLPSTRPQVKSDNRVDD